MTIVQIENNRQRIVKTSKGQAQWQVGQLSQNQVLILQNAMLFAYIVLPFSEQLENFSIIVFLLFILLCWTWGKCIVCIFKNSGCSIENKIA